MTPRLIAGLAPGLTPNVINHENSLVRGGLEADPL